MDDYSYNYLLVTVLALMGAGFGLTPILIARLLAPRKPSGLKSGTFECGLQASGDPWIQFSIRYYHYAIAFVIFSIEAVFLLPWAAAFLELSWVGVAGMGLFLLLLTEGLAWMWGRGFLEWQ